MKKILVIQNSAHETLGTLQPLFEEDGFELETVVASGGDKVPAKLDQYMAVVILGGPASAYDDHQYLREEEKLIQNAMARNIPTLGICLGSQLVAKAAGASVYKGQRKEIGWYQVELTGEGMEAFKSMQKNIMTFQWHGDTYDLPNNAVVLARSDTYPVQAFRVGSALGVQFHLEVTREMVVQWVKEYRKELESVSSYINVDNLLSEMDAKIGALNLHAKTLYKNFRRQVSD